MELCFTLATRVSWQWQSSLLGPKIQVSRQREIKLALEILQEHKPP